MTIRAIVKIDEEKCDGCGQCVPGCAEGALQIIDGKARLVRESYCDGLGACLGVCPQGAISIEQRGADDFDEKAVEAAMKLSAGHPAPQPAARKEPAARKSAGCPGLQVLQFGPIGAAAKTPGPGSAATPGAASELRQWPIQLALVPPTAPYLQGADVLLVADCVPVAMPDFQSRLLAGRSVLMGCPKLDDNSPYIAKLKAIFELADLKSLTIARMEVPCCGGLSRIVRAALVASGRSVPVTEITVGIDGRLVGQQVWP